MTQKIKKNVLIGQYRDKIMNEWSTLTYDEIRKKIFEDSSIEVNNYDIQTYISKNGLSSERRKKNSKLIDTKYKYVETLRCGYNQIKA